MTFNDYQSSCLLTEAPIDDGVRQRFNECLGTLEGMLDAREDLDLADEVKRYIFYGKKPCGRTWHSITYDQSYAVCSTLRSFDDQTIRLIHAFLGIVSEIPELADAILSGDKVNIAEEFADVYWYNSIGLDAIGVKASDSASANLAKLKARYPERFSQESAVNRDLANESAILSDHILTE